jgi:hypothetical protein
MPWEGEVLHGQGLKMPRKERSYTALISSVPTRRGLKMPPRERTYTASAARSYAVLEANYRGTSYRCGLKMPRKERSYTALISSVPTRRGLKMPSRERTYTTLAARSGSKVLGCLGREGLHCLEIMKRLAARS